MKYRVRRVQEQIVDSNEWIFGEDEFEAIVAIEVAESIADGWDTVDLDVVELGGE